MRRVIGCLALVVAVVVHTAAGQGQAQPTPTRPDFSGAWTLMDREGVAYSPLGGQVVVEQNADTITLATPPRGSLTYALNGSETRRVATSAAGAPWTYTSQARFVSHALLITTTYEFGAGQGADLMVMSLDGRGRLILVAVATPKGRVPTMSTRTFEYQRR